MPTDTANPATRRAFLAACGATAFLGLRPARRARAQAGPAVPAIESLGDGLAAITGAGGTVVALAGEAGLLLVDTGTAAAAEAVRALLDTQFPGLPVTTVVNTHWHLAHTGGNDALTGSETQIVAHENTRLWMSTKFYVDWEDTYYSPRAAAALPNDTFYSSDPQPLELRFGGEPVVYGHLPEAHTDGDIYVHLPERNLIVAGGTATDGRYPVLDYATGGWIGGLVDATGVLIGLSNAATRILPAAGRALGVTDLEAQRAMLETVRERVEAMALEGRGIDDMIAAGITEEFDPIYGEPDEFINNVYQGLWWGNRLRGIVA